MKSKITHSWERRPDESAQAYEVFCYFRDLGPDRTFERAFNESKKSDDDVEWRLELWTDSSAKYHWEERAKAYDDDIEKARRRTTKMDSSITHSSERFPGESSKAYRAFCYFRDLGPSRSLDRAWESHCVTSNEGKDREGKVLRSARCPGYWGDWSVKYNWVARAGAYDDDIEEEGRIAAVEQRRAFQKECLKFALKELEQLENLVRTADSVLEKLAAAPSYDVTQVTRDPVTNKTTTTKGNGLDPRGMAILMTARLRAARQALEGVLENNGLEEEKPKAERVVWIKSDKAA